MVTASWSTRGGAVLVMFGKAFVELDWPSNTSYLQEEGAELHKGFRVRSSIEPHCTKICIAFTPWPSSKPMLPPGFCLYTHPSRSTARHGAHPVLLSWMQDHWIILPSLREQEGRTVQGGWGTIVGIFSTCTRKDTWREAQQMLSSTYIKVLSDLEGQEKQNSSCMPIV